MAPSVRFCSCTCPYRAISGAALCMPSAQQRARTRCRAPLMPAACAPNPQVPSSPRSRGGVAAHWSAHLVYPVRHSISQASAAAAPLAHVVSYERPAVRTVLQICDLQQPWHAPLAPMGPLVHVHTHESYRTQCHALAGVVGRRAGRVAMRWSPPGRVRPRPKCRPGHKAGGAACTLYK